MVLPVCVCGRWQDVFNGSLEDMHFPGQPFSITLVIRDGWAAARAGLSRAPPCWLDRT